MIPPPDPSPPQRFRAEVVRLIFRAPSSSFMVLELKALGDSEGLGVFRAAGEVPPVQVGQQLSLCGSWEEHPKHGRQLRLEDALPLLPETQAALQKYLSAGVVDGIGPALATRIVQTLGDAVWAALEHPPEGAQAGAGLECVPGLGQERARRLKHFWQTQRHEHRARMLLAELEVPGALTDQILSRYGNQTEATLKTNPWLLAEELRGVGFIRADALAARLGVAPDALPRAQAAVRWLLSRSQEEGDVYCPASRLLEQAQTLGLPPARVLEAIHSLKQAGEVVIEALESQNAPETLPEDQALFLSALWKQEVAVAEQLRARLRRCTDSDVPQDDAVEDRLNALEVSQGLTLAPEQREAVKKGLTAPLLLISGGPGTGKTTLVRALLALLSRAGTQVKLAAPTGRAARRLQEATGQEAQTLHRLLEVQPPGMLPARTRANPLEGDLLLVDEASMIDLPLFAWLLDALPESMRLVLVGDVDQLAPVGPGNVLDALLRTPTTPKVLLSQVFRQGQSSLIHLNAQRIRRGLTPLLPHGAAVLEADFFFVEAPEPECCLERVIELVTRRLPERYGLDPRKDIQVLSPTHRGETGVARLNERLQAVLNPRAAADRRRGFRPGDKVMQVRNRPESGLYNGDIGFVLAAEEGAVQVAFDEREVHITGPALQELERAWAMTVHRAQGSEFPVVVMPLTEGTLGMMKRNLLYTAVTRARRLVVLVGSRRVLEAGGWVREVRSSRLWERLMRLDRDKTV